MEGVWNADAIRLDRLADGTGEGRGKADCGDRVATHQRHAEKHARRALELAVRRQELCLGQGMAGPDIAAGDGRRGELVAELVAVPMELRQRREGFYGYE